MKKIDIIGAGIAGLSAGCYLQMNGYDTTIYEMHNIPGGLCTAWTRRGYTFEGCLHWLVGSSPGDDFYHMWNELLDMKKYEFHDSDLYFRFENNDPAIFINFYKDIDLLEEELLTKAPEDEEPVKEMTNAVRKFSNLQLPVTKAREVMGMGDGLKLFKNLFPYFKEMKKWASVSGEDFSKRFKNPLLKRSIKNLFIPEMSFLFMIMNLSWMNKKTAGYPLGGSLKFTREIENRYIDLGGKLRYSEKVKRIRTEDGKASGLELQSGEFTDSDIVISAADGHSTIFNLLEGRYLNRKITGYYNNFKPFPSFIQVSLGINRTFENDPEILSIPVDGGLKVDPATNLESIEIRIFNFDDSLAPEGSTAITLILPTYNYRYWDGLRKTDLKEYRNEKNRIAASVSDILEKRFGNISDNIEVADVSTPATVMRYTGNWKGSFEGWILTPEIALKQLDKSLPGLKDFYMAGQWVEPGGGVPAVLMSGRNVSQIICKKDKKEFKTTSF